MGEQPVAVVGLVGGEVFGDAARRAVNDAEVLVGSSRHLAVVDRAEDVETLEIRGPLPELLDAIAAHRRLRRVCVLASGDPGFFGIVRSLGARLGPGALRVHPAPSSVALAWAAVGLPWDDATVVSAHGRPVDDAVAAAVSAPKVAVLTSPDAPPQLIGSRLQAAGCGPRRVVVVSQIGEAGEAVADTDLAGLAAGTFDPMSVVLLVEPDHRSDAPSLSWGAPESAFEHRAGMVTKSEVRAVVLARLALPRRGVLWDVGAGSGSVGIEAATVSPGLSVLAVENDGDQADRILRNAAGAGVEDQVAAVVGRAPEALADLPDPDRVFVGGGGLPVVEAAWRRLPSGGALVATFVVLDRAVAAMELLGDMVQLHVDRAVPIGGVGMRLEPTNPVFICWGRR